MHIQQMRLEFYPTKASNDFIEPALEIVIKSNLQNTDLTNFVRRTYC